MAGAVAAGEPATAAIGTVTARAIDTTGAAIRGKVAAGAAGRLCSAAAAAVIETGAAAAAGDHFIDVDSVRPVVGLDDEAAATTAAGADTGRRTALTANDDLELCASLKIDGAARHRAEPAKGEIPLAAAAAITTLRARGGDVVIAGGLDRECLDRAGIVESRADVGRQHGGRRQRITAGSVRQGEREYLGRPGEGRRRAQRQSVELAGDVGRRTGQRVDAIAACESDARRM